jgi:hypothetical protein
MRKLILAACAAFTLSGCIAFDEMYDDQARTECDSETTPRERGACYDRVEQHRRDNP